VSEDRSLIDSSSEPGAKPAMPKPEAAKSVVKKVEQKKQAEKVRDRADLENNAINAPVNMNLILGQSKETPDNSLTNEMRIDSSLLEGKADPINDAPGHALSITDIVNVGASTPGSAAA